jgi:hypothetical protein
MLPTQEGSPETLRLFGQVGVLEIVAETLNKGKGHLRVIVVVETTHELLRGWTPTRHPTGTSDRNRHSSPRVSTPGCACLINTGGDSYRVGRRIPPSATNSSTRAARRSPRSPPFVPLRQASLRGARQRLLRMGSPPRHHREPYYFTRSDEELLLLAGLYEYWRNPNDDEWIATCTIVTTTPSADLEEIHDRMPVVLETDEVETWLNVADFGPDERLALVRPAPQETLAHYEVSKAVGSVKNSGPELAEPVQPQSLF